MGQEIERKFLINKNIWEQTHKAQGRYLRQGYITSEPGKTIRVRVTDTDCFLTIKGITDGISRAEYEYQIPSQDAHELLNLFAPSCIEKTRYEINYKGKLWEVDVFRGDNEGLIIAEIELESIDEKFDLPDWIVREVSDDLRYFNSNLSKNPYKNWKDNIL